MVVRNNMDRFQLAIDSLARLPEWATRAAAAVEAFRAKLASHAAYVVEHGEDLPEIQSWRWTG
jgi:xylulose-5-phosphate/fructose-6-phosphate phosphoketolase